MSQQEIQEKRKMSASGKVRAIAASKEIVRSPCSPLWRVESENTAPKFHEVVYLDGELMCGCKAFENGMTDPCKHIIAVALLETRAV